MTLPEGLSEELWSEFKAHRKAIKARMTVFAEKRVLARLHKLKAQGEDIEDVVVRSIENGWRGVFPVPPQERVSRAPYHREAPQEITRKPVQSMDRITKELDKLQGMMKR